METFSALLVICAGNSLVPGEFPVQSQWHGALMFSLICAWINGWVNNGEAGDLRRHQAHCDFIVMYFWSFVWPIHQRLVNSTYKGWRKWSTVMLVCVWNMYTHFLNRFQFFRFCAHIFFINNHMLHVFPTNIHVLLIFNEQTSHT